MKKGFSGGIFHACSPKDKPYHDHYDIRWCRYLQDIDNQTATGLAPECIKHVKEILVDLTSDGLLKKCLHGKTQNPNERLNAMIWNSAKRNIHWFEAIRNWCI